MDLISMFAQVIGHLIGTLIAIGTEESSRFFLHLVILIASAKILGELCEKVGLLSVIGYIVAGILAGPMFLNIVAADEIFLFSEIGVVMLLFMSGFKQGNISEILENKKTIVMISSMGYIFPVVATILIALYAPPLLGVPPIEFNYILVLMIAVAASDIGMTVRTLADLRKLNTKIGRAMLGVTLMDSVTGLLVVTLVLTYVKMGTVGLEQILTVLFSILSFFCIFMLLRWVIPRIVDRTERLTIEEAQFAFAFIFILLLAIIAEGFGIDGIIGAFLAGIILSRSPIVETDFIEKISAVSYAIFIPLFFVWTGLLLNITTINILSVLFVLGALGANLVGAGLASYLSGMRDRDEILAIGFGMIPRGDVNLVILSIGMQIAPREVSDLMITTVMLMILVSVLVAPMALKIVLKGKEMR